MRAGVLILQDILTIVNNKYLQKKKMEKESLTISVLRGWERISRLQIRRGGGQFCSWLGSLISINLPQRYNSLPCRVILGSEQTDLLPVTDSTAKRLNSIFTSKS